VQHRLAQHLQRHHDQRDMKPRISHIGPDEPITPAAHLQRELAFPGVRLHHLVNPETANPLDRAILTPGAHFREITSSHASRAGSPEHGSPVSRPGQRETAQHHRQTTLGERCSAGGR
jgi:hypothetical protein